MQDMVQMLDWWIDVWMLKRRKFPVGSAGPQHPQALLLPGGKAGKNARHQGGRTDLPVLVGMEGEWDAGARCGMGNLLKLCLICTVLMCGRGAAGDDAQVLLSVKQELYSTASNLGKLDFWNTSAGNSLCSWRGVGCCGASSTVCSLSLQFLGLQGPLPGGLGSLANLTELHLDDNNFTGGIPAGLFQAAGLQNLSLGYNALSGPIPADIGKLQELGMLDVRWNGLVGTLEPLQGLNPATLQGLYLDGNGFSGDLSPLAAFTGLRTLSVMRNQVNGTLDALGGALAGLESLFLAHNQMSGTVDALGDASGLRSLDLGYNQFDGQLPASLAGLLSLQYLRLNSNGFGGEIPSALGVLRLQLLRLVNFSSNQFTGPIPSRICSTLGTIDLSDNQLNGSIPETFFNSSCQSMVDVRLGGNELTGNFMGAFSTALSTLPTILTLNLSGNSLSGSASRIKTRLPNLQRLLLSKNNFSSALLQDVLASQFISLEEVDLSQNGLEGNLDLGFNQMDNLQSLNLSHNRISGGVPTQLVYLAASEQLQSLDLSYNLFSGQLPSFPFNSSYEYSFAGNSGLCSSDPAAQLPASCQIQGPPSPGSPGSPQGSPGSPQGSPVTTVVGAAVAGSVAVVIVISAFVLWRSRVKAARLETTDPALTAAIQEGVNVAPMPVSILRVATQNFSDSNKIGFGGFGTVYRGTLPDGREVAIKVSKRVGSEEDKRQFLNEVRILAQVNYRGLVLLVGCCLTPNLAALVFEFVSQGTLEEHLRGRRGPAGGLTWERRLTIAFQTADAIAYLHSRANPQIIHRDVKSANILLDDNLDAKVADFGISRTAALAATHVSTLTAGTPGYMDPESFITGQLTAKSDVYAFGVVLIELLTAKPPIGLEGSNVVPAVQATKRDELDQVLDAPLRHRYGMDAASRSSMRVVAELAVQCLQQRPADRPSMTELVTELEQQVRYHRSKPGKTMEEHDQAPLLSDSKNPGSLSDAFNPGPDTLEIIRAGITPIHLSGR